MGSSQCLFCPSSIALAIQVRVSCSSLLFSCYEIAHKGYRCYDSISCRLCIFQNVIFWEHKLFIEIPKTHLLSFSLPLYLTNPLADLFPENSSPDSEQSLTPPDELSSQEDLSTLGSPAHDPPTPNSPRYPCSVRTQPTYFCDYHCFSSICST